MTPWTFQKKLFLSLWIVGLVLYFVFHDLLNSPNFRRNQLLNPSQVFAQQAVALQSERPRSLADQGLAYLTKTSQLLPKYVGAKINCTNCHMNGGQTPHAGPWINVSKRYPKYRNRTAKQVTLTERVNDCFERSMNGKALPEDHSVMNAILAYMNSLETSDEVKGVGVTKLVLQRDPDLRHGEQVYQAKCVQCHQKSGQGMILEDGTIVYPPLWGDKSFNIGAGMARLHTAAGFVKHNMPLGQGGSLSDDEAWDVAFYFSQQNRPDFAEKSKDWPKGNKPKDARY